MKDSKVLPENAVDTHQRRVLQLGSKILHQVRLQNIWLGVGMLVWVVQAELVSAVGCMAMAKSDAVCSALTETCNAAHSIVTGFMCMAVIRYYRLVQRMVRLGSTLPEHLTLLHYARDTPVLPEMALTLAHAFPGSSQVGGLHLVLSLATASILSRFVFAAFRTTYWRSSVNSSAGALAAKLMNIQLPPTSVIRM